jgi:hypothetical protein
MKEVFEHIRVSLQDVGKGIELYARLPVCNASTLAKFRKGEDLRKLRNEGFWRELVEVMDFRTRQGRKMEILPAVVEVVALPTQQPEILPTKEVQAQEILLDDLPTDYEGLVKEKARLRNVIGKANDALAMLGTANDAESVANRVPLVQTILKAGEMMTEVDERIGEIEGKVQRVVNTDIDALYQAKRNLDANVTKAKKRIEELEKRLQDEPKNEKLATQISQLKLKYQLLKQEQTEAGIRVDAAKQDRL